MDNTGSAGVDGRARGGATGAMELRDLLQPVRVVLITTNPATNIKLYFFAIYPPSGGGINFVDCHNGLMGRK